MAGAIAEAGKTAAAKLTEVMPSRQDWRKDLPPFYQAGFTNFIARAQELDKEHTHFWVHVNQTNQAIKLSKGWAPVEDEGELKRLGLGALVQANHRARYVDTELWRRPRRVSEAVQKLHVEQVASKSAALKATLEAQAEDAAGRSRGEVVPFVTTGMSGDVLTKESIKI